MSKTVLSLVIPIFNEADHLERWCDTLFAFKFPISTEFIFVNDASTDASEAILEKYKSHPGVRLFTQPENQGKGAALRVGIAATLGEIVLVQDADFEYSLKDVPRVIQPILDDEADVVFGSRYKQSTTVHRTFHYAINRALTLASNLSSGLYLTDMETCYKAVRGEIIRNIDIQSPRFGFEPEITSKLAALKVRVAEVPISYFPRTYLEGKKIRWTDGVAALWHIARFNLDRRNTQRAVAKVPDRFKAKSTQWL